LRQAVCSAQSDLRKPRRDRSGDLNFTGTIEPGTFGEHGCEAGGRNWRDDGSAGLLIPTSDSHKECERLRKEYETDFTRLPQ